MSNIKPNLTLYSCRKGIANGARKGIANGAECFMGDVKSRRLRGRFCNKIVRGNAFSLFQPTEFISAKTLNLFLMILGDTLLSIGEKWN